jgi:hypothetical protein
MMPPETPNPDLPKVMRPHRLVWLLGSTIAPAFAIPWFVAELQGRRFNDAAVVFMLLEGVAVTLLLRWLCELWPDLLTCALRGTQPQSRWRRPAAVAIGIVLACLANSFFTAYSLVGLPVDPGPDRGAMLTLLILTGLIWLIGAFAFVLAIAAAALKPAATVGEIHPGEGLKDVT